MFLQMISDDEIPEFAENLDLTNIVTPVDVRELVRLLRESKYDEQEIAYLENSFTYGFDIGYQGSKDRQSSAKNI